jgi:uncharacterized protein (DUF1697 family)
VVTVLRSGNVVFDAADDDAAVDAGVLAQSIRRAVAERVGVTADVLVLDARTFRRIAGENPLTGRASDPSRLLVTFLSAPVPAGLTIPDAAALAPEELAVGTLAVYQWLPDGVLQSKVGRAFWSQFDGPVTARNARTVGRLAALAE